MRSKDIRQKLKSILCSDASVHEKTRQKLELLSQITPPVTEKGWDLLLILVSDVAYCPYCIELKQRLGVTYVKEYCRKHCELVSIVNEHQGETVYKDCHEMALVSSIIDAAVEEAVDAFVKACRDALDAFKEMIGTLETD